MTPNATSPSSPESASPTSRATLCFETTFGSAPALIACAPGRVNLIGEHTDYNDGFVFPAAIEFHTAVAASPRSDRSLEVIALDESSQMVTIDLDAEPSFDEQFFWSNYIRGVVSELHKAGYKLAGANLAISGNVPLGAGLSSSAALEMAIVSALTQLSEQSITAAQAAKVGQAAENNFVGCNCGIMDQMISAAGRAGHALMLDCRDLTLHAAPIPENLAIVVINSNQRRALVDGEYNARRAQCEEAAKHYGVAALRDLTLAELESKKGALDAIALKRARHVVTENQRTLDMRQALKHDDSKAISELMARSHASMRDDFEITTPQIDALVEIVTSVIGNEGGVRMTGGGFGGCIVALVPKQRVSDVIGAVDRDYPEISGHAATTFVCNAADGAFSNQAGISEPAL